MTIDITAVQTQAIAAIIVPGLIQIAKRSKAACLNWVDGKQPQLCVMLSVVVSLGTSLGVTMQHTPGHINLAYPTGGLLISNLVNFLIHSIGQLGGQHVTYKSFWKWAIPAPSPEVNFPHSRPGPGGHPAHALEVDDATRPTNVALPDTPM